MKIAEKKSRSWLLVPIIALVAIGVAATVYTLALKTKSSSPGQQATSKSTPAAKPATLLLPGAKTPIPLPIDKTMLTRPAGQLILVNKQQPIDLAYVPTDLVLPDVPYRTDKSKEEVMVRSMLIAPLKDMFAAAKSAGIELMIGSAYRSSQLQATYFNSYVKASGQAEAEKYSAHPGTSEHQLGLAADLTTTDRACYLVECFETTAAGQWLALHAHEYGFILRYPKGKTDLTGYQFEPWHFRYLGKTIATAVYESGLTYEEAYPYLSGGKQ